MKDRTPIGKVLSSIRIEQGLDQSEMARSLCITKNYLSKIERGYRPLNLSIASRAISKVDKEYKKELASCCVETLLGKEALESISGQK